jgi:hypothetical protein
MQIVIKYKAVTPVVHKAVAQICGVYYPNSAAADLKPFDGTYYDTNVAGVGEGLHLEKFMSQQVAFPGLNAYLRKAIRDGEFSFESDDQKLQLYLQECAPALKDQGFTFTFA